jgi:hypothetical protein
VNRNRGETEEKPQQAVWARYVITRGDTHKPYEKHAPLRFKKKQRGTAIITAGGSTPRDTRRLTSVSQPTPPLLTLIIVVVTVPQASVSQHDLELSTVQRRRRGDTQAEGKQNRKAVWAYEPSRTISRTIGRDLHTRRIVSPNAQMRERLTSKPEGLETEEPVENLK